MRLRRAIIGIVFLLSIVIASTSALGAVKATAIFSPEEVWTAQIPGSYDSLKSTYTMDVNLDDKAEIMVKMENYDAHTYQVMLLNGSDGEVMKTTKFTDTGYSESGDTVGMDATLYGITILNSQGGLLDEHYFMVFGNHSNNKRVSIYSVDYPSLQNISYRGIDIPSTITYLGYNIPVVSYGWIFHTLEVNSEPRLVYFGYYLGNYLGYQFEQLQIIMMDKNLNTLWDKTLTSPMVNYFPYGVDLVSFNGWGFHNDHEDVLIINLTASAGNTTLDAIDASTGALMWSTQLNGIYTVTLPIHAIPYPLAYQYDYDGDGTTDLAIPTITQNKEYRIYFVNSNGNVMGYYTANGPSIFALYTDTLVSSNLHNLVGSVDVNGDNYRDVFLLDNNTYLVCWDVVNNKSLWSVDIAAGNYHYIPFLSTNDVSGDGIWDLYLIGQENNGNTAVIKAISSAEGSVLFSKSYSDVIGIPIPGTVGVKEITDVNDDGFQDALVMQGYYNDGSVYINLTALSLKDGSEIWKTEVHSELNNNDYGNWSSQAMFGGDMNGDGTNDVVVRLYYHDINAAQYYTYLRVLSGTDGEVMWNGKVEGDSAPTDLFPFFALTIGTPWNQFDYNGDGIINEMLITTGYSVQIYALSQPIPELTYVAVLLVLPAIVLLLKRRK